MRILVIGGTRFVGRHVVAAALDAGHEVTLFHRGRTGRDLFPQAEHRTGDRDRDLSALGTGRWDATVDCCAYLPGQVESLAAALGGRGGRYALISSVSAYRAPAPAGFGEDAPLAELAGPVPDEVTDVTYGPLKVACERAAAAAYGAGAVTVIRPTYVIGPYDHSYRMTWWVERIARGGEVLAPGDPADPIQVIDARDLGAWTVRALAGGTAGVFHAAGPSARFGFGELLDAVAAEVAPPGTRLAWAGSDFLRAAGADAMALPLWPGADPVDATLNRADPAAAVAAGLVMRPLRASVADIHAHERAARTPVPDGIGMDPEREAALLRDWAAARA
jgi:2'-hydroxyisoflavone reductase